eukprot:TRINITY_DN1539_c1_g2_i1.p1 TRINITY_DN1539_c1_g2~~TRINITY_DN1539_c1_g2_i1.p1  ORF type:complete len:293 (-),score=82.49 TRINITY_DN1539_c1_g2_i1:268-1146(-)
MMHREANSSPNDSGSDLEPETEGRDRGISMALLFCVEEALRKEDESSQRKASPGEKVFQNEPKLDDNDKMIQDSSLSQNDSPSGSSSKVSSSPPIKRTRRVYLHERSIPEGWSIEGPFYDTDRTTYLWHASDGQIWPTFKSAEQYWISKGEAIKEGMPAVWSGPPSAVSWTSWRDWRRREKAKTKNTDVTNMRMIRQENGSNKRKRNSEDYDSSPSRDDYTESPKRRKDKSQTQKQFLDQQFINDQFPPAAQRKPEINAVTGLDSKEVQQFWFQNSRANEQLQHQQHQKKVM